MRQRASSRTLTLLLLPAALTGACASDTKQPRPAPIDAPVADGRADTRTEGNSRDAAPKPDLPLYMSPPPPPAALSPWTSADVGTVPVKGVSGATIDRFMVTGSGAGIGGAQDAFQFTYQKVTGNVAVIGKLRTVDYADAETRAGLMIRGGLEPGAPNVFVGATGKVLGVVQTRAAAGATTKAELASADIKTGTWIRIARVGGNVVVDRSADKVMWTAVGSYPVTLPSEVYVGMAVSSNNATVLARAEYDGMRITNLGLDDATKPWWLEDVGIIGGYALHDKGTFKIGAPGDAWTNVREFMNLAFQEITGDATITARVAKIEGTDPNARIVIGFRVGTVSGGSSRGAQHAMAALTPAGGAQFRVRPRADMDVMAGEAQAALKAPLWLRVERVGETFKASTSANGRMWTPLGEGTIPMIAPKLAVGIGVSSNAMTAFAHAEVDSVSIVSAGGATDAGAPADAPAADAPAADARADAAADTRADTAVDMRADTRRR